MTGDERGLRSEGATAAAIGVGLSFEKEVGAFCDFLEATYPGEFVFTKDKAILPPKMLRRLTQFIALASPHPLSPTPPLAPAIGDVWLDGDTVMTLDASGSWKPALEGIGPDRVLLSKRTQRFVLVEAKWGDTEGNAHIERAGARATPHFFKKIDEVFEGQARYFFIFGGPMITARRRDLGNKVAQRGRRKDQVVQSPRHRQFASARYHRTIEMMFGDRLDDVLLWDEHPHIPAVDQLKARFETRLRPWLIENRN